MLIFAGSTSSFNGLSDFTFSVANGGGQINNPNHGAPNYLGTYDGGTHGNNSSEYYGGAGGGAGVKGNGGNGGNGNSSGTGYNGQSATNNSGAGGGSAGCGSSGGGSGGSGGSGYLRIIY